MDIMQTFNYSPVHEGVFSLYNKYYPQSNGAIVIYCIYVWCTISQQSTFLHALRNSYICTFQNLLQLRCVYFPLNWFVYKLSHIYITHNSIQLNITRSKGQNEVLLVNLNKDRHIEFCLPFSFYHYFIVIEDRSCTSCLNLRVKHSADSNACKQIKKRKKKGRGDHNQKYIQRSNYVQEIPGLPLCHFQSECSP